MDKLFESSNFIHNEIDVDIEKHPDMTVHTRFPPEPSGFFHIGHVKAISLNFSTAQKYGGFCNLRMDDTNPILEKKEYVDAIQRDIKWLGFTWHERVFYASEYFDKCYEYALKLIDEGNAFVCDLNAEELHEYRGTLTEPGKNSPYRERSPEENRKLFLGMKDGLYEDGNRTLRAKIDMKSGNINMRDPVIYRIMHKEHSHTGNKWVIYPMYDYAHPIQDAIEGITHSLCDVGFEDHRPLYEWVLKKTGHGEFPKQREFARLNITHTITSKRKLRDIVESGKVSGWDDPRMPTIAGLRRRGFTPESLLTFIEKVGVAKTYSVVDMALLEFCIRDELNKTANRVMAVLDPVKVVITNYDDDNTDNLTVENNPEDPSAGSRTVPFSREIYIERSDFMVDPPRKFFRLSPGREVRLKSAYFIKCVDYDTDENGIVTEIRCTYDPLSRGGNSPDGRKVRGTLHWVSVELSIEAEIRLYDRLTRYETPSEFPKDAKAADLVNPDSLNILKARMEPSLAKASVGDRFQFMRTGYFCCDPDSKPEYLVFNRIVPLRDTWAKIKSKGK